MAWERVREEENPAVVRPLGMLQSVVLELVSLEGFGVENDHWFEIALDRCVDERLERRHIQFVSKHQGEALLWVDSIELHSAHTGLHVPLTRGMVVTYPTVLPEARCLSIAASLARLMAPMPFVDIAQLGRQLFVAARAIAAFIRCRGNAPAISAADLNTSSWSR